MAARNVFRIIFSGSEWQIIKNGKILKNFVKREDAETAAQLYVDEYLSSEAYIYRYDGSIQKTFINFQKM
jgi:hypothetical protein